MGTIITLDRAPEDFAKLYAYCVRDIITEAEASSRLPDLAPREFRIWQTDQRINLRGMYIDRVAVENCLAIVEQASEKYNFELRCITCGAVQKSSEVAATLQWLRNRGVYLDNLDEDTVYETLDRKDLPADVLRVVRIRQLLAFGSVKKLYAMRSQTAMDGRLCNQYAYHGAHTSLWNGYNVQMANLYTGKLKTPREIEMALACIATRHLPTVEACYGDAMEVVADCLRSMVCAAPGHDLVSADYSAIQAVVLACLAGEQWQIDVFKTHGKIYEATAAGITGKTLQFYLDYRKETGKHHPDRQDMGKIPTLACLTAQTQVLTNRGYVDMVRVLSTDLLWDGVKWVKHGGLIEKGERSVLNLDGVEMTPNHPINIGHSWLRADALLEKKEYLHQALAHGSENLPFCGLSDCGAAKDQETIGVRKLNARAVERRILSLWRRFAEEQAPAVTRAQKEKPLIHPSLNDMQNMRGLSQTWNIVGDSLTVFLRRLVAVIAPPIPHSITTGGGGFLFVTNGVRIEDHSSPMCSRWTGGIIQILKWIAKTAIKVTSRVISDSLIEDQTPKIAEKFPSYNAESLNLKTVYDIVDAGPRHRFTIKTDSGHLIVHNSGFGAWVPGWKRFGADAYGDDAAIKEMILRTRAKIPATVEFWGGQTRNKFNRAPDGSWDPERPECYGLEGAAVRAIENPGVTFGFRGITYTVMHDILYCQPPTDGEPIQYHEPRLNKSERNYASEWEKEITYVGWNSSAKKGRSGWSRMKLYGGVLTQNVVAKVAREFQANALCDLDESGYPIVMHTHDEGVAEVRERTGSTAEYLGIVNRRPAWAVLPDGTPWPVKAPDAWRAKRYGKWESDHWTEAEGFVREV